MDEPDNVLAGIDAYMDAARADLRRVGRWGWWAVLLYACAAFNLAIGVHALVQFDRTGSFLSLCAVVFNAWAFVATVRGIERNKRSRRELTALLRRRIEEAAAVRSRVVRDHSC